VIPAWSLLALLLVQLTLGVLIVLLKKPADVASYHVAVGAAVLATTFLIAARSMRLFAPALARRESGGFEMPRHAEEALVAQ
jgi:heme A synthase